MPNNEYTQEIALNFVTNLEEISNQIEMLKEDANKIALGDEKEEKKETFGDKVSKKIESSIYSIPQGFQQGIDEILESSEVLSDAVEIFKGIVQLDFAMGIAKLISGIGNLFKKAWEEMNNMISYTQMTDSSIREMKLSLGLTDSESWAMSKMNTIMGISGIEDMLWMNDQQWKLYNNGMTRLIQMFEETIGSNKDLAETMYEFNVEFEIFKIQLLQPFMEMIIKNKDLIMGLFQTLVGVMPQLLEKLLNYTGGYYSLGGTFRTNKKLAKDYEGDDLKFWKAVYHDYYNEGILTSDALPAYKGETMEEAYRRNPEWHSQYNSIVNNYNLYSNDYVTEIATQGGQ